MTTKGDSKRGKTDDKSKLARPKDAVKDLKPKAPADAENVRGGKGKSMSKTEVDW